MIRADLRVRALIEAARALDYALDELVERPSPPFVVDRTRDAREAVGEALKAALQREVA